MTSRLGVLLIMFVTAPRWALAGPVIWLEAEQFAEKGGWVNDPQFVDLMGSPYLLANGVGAPVDDAVTTTQVQQPGQYRLWVRCRDWVPGHSPGRFQVVLNGRPAAVDFGKAEDDAWQWVAGGAVTLESGPLEVRLHDLTGWWGRCDAVALTQGDRPSDDLTELAHQRQQYGGVSASLRKLGPYDFVVVGGGLAGCAAAIAAARQGCRVALIQDRPVLGGNASSEIKVGPSGDTSNEPLDPRETGILEELEPPRGERSAWYETLVRSESGLDLFLNTRATGVTMRGDSTVATVLAMNVETGERFEFAGETFADCTGDGWVGYWAGADFRTGREGRDEYGEPAAPPKADAHSLSTSLTQCQIVTRDQPAPFEAPTWAPTWTACDQFDQSPKATVHSRGDLPPEGWHELARGRGRHPDSADAIRGTWWLELGGMQDTIADAERIRDDLFRLKLGLWDHVKNHCPRYAEQNRNRELVWNSHLAGKRESRRLLGDYVLTQRDYMEHTIHPDTVLYAGYNVDPHNPQGFWTKGAQAFRLYHYKVSVPFRTLYSRNVDNLFMAGRNFSASHIAMNGARVMRITCLMGQVVGTAAGLAKRHSATPREVYQRHLTELQQTLLRDGCYLMNTPNRDPEDLALRATVTASSFARIADPRAQGEGPHGGMSHALDAPRAVMFTAAEDRLASVDLHLKSELPAPVELTATLCAAAKLGDFNHSEQLATARATVPANSEGWVRFALTAKLQPGRLYFVWLPASEGLSWQLYESQVEGTARAYRSANGWNTMSHCYRYRLTPGGEPATAAEPVGKVDLLPGNVNNGWNRAVAGAPNSWGPNPEATGPHWLELDFGSEVTLTEVHVTFQLPTMRAEDYDLGIPEGNRWRVICSVRGNQARRAVSQFAPVITRRLRLMLVGEDRETRRVRVCEVRVYGRTA